MHQPVLLLLIQVSLILALSRAMGMLFARVRQPQVIGEMVAGIMLGPSLLGLVSPAAQRALFPAESIPLLNTLSQFGVVFFLFLIGLELDPKLLKSRGRSAAAVGIASIAFPFALGACVTVLMWRNGMFAGQNRGFTAAILFMGAAMSVTAFPVLARILTERNLHKTELGAIAIASAAFNDVAAWVMLAFVVAVANASGPISAGRTALLSVAYVLAMFLVVRPFLNRLQLVYDRQGRLSQGVLAIIFLLVLGSAIATEWIGIHAMFGAFVLGFVMPKGTRFVHQLSEKLEDFTVVLLLPIFFAYAGLRTRLGLLNEPAMWGFAALIISAACIGKFGGTTLSARAFGNTWREASAIGVLMNTRGLMELVILTVGLQLGVINETVFAMMVVMALVTTFMTTPLLHWIYPAARSAGRAVDPTSARRGYSILIPVAAPTSGKPLLQLANAISGAASPDRAIYALHLSRPAEQQRFAYRSGLEPAQGQSADPRLESLLAFAATQSIPVEPISFVSRDVAADVARVARERQADLVLIGFHRPVFGKKILGGVVHRVLTGAETDVGVFVDRGFHGVRTVLVPYMGTPHDRLALDLAHRLGRNLECEVTVLHIVPPTQSSTTVDSAAQSAVDRAFKDPSHPMPVKFKVVSDPSPVDAVVREAQAFDLVVVGVAEEWGLQSHLFGWRAERIAEKCASSLLMVRRHDRDDGHRGSTEEAGPATEIKDALTGEQAVAAIFPTAKAP